MSFLSAILLPMTVRETGAAVVYAAVEPIGLENISIEITSADEILAVFDGIDPAKGSQKILIELNRPTQDGEVLKAKATSGDRVEQTDVVEMRGGDVAFNLWIITGFHYDPVWWNTQSNYLAAGDGMKPERDGAFGLIDGFLDACRKDEDYKFVLEQVPYLKPYWDAYPEEREFMSELINNGRLQVLGGMYCEAQTNHIGAEANARNFVYGCRYMDAIYGAKQEAAWQCDCFGHDPNFAQFCAASGLKWASFARAAFHHFGVGFEDQNIPSEFRWLGPDGSEIFAHYMSGHYDYYYKWLKGRENDEFNAYLMWAFLDLKQTSATHNICIPLLGDFGPAIPELAEQCRAFNARYEGIDARLGTFGDFTASVEAEVTSRDIYLRPIARDLNPVLSGCNLTFEDTKQAQRAAENALLTAETIAAIAGMFGAEYPSGDFSRAWRQLMFCTHHDAITGSEGGEVYLHLLSSWRTAVDIGESIEENGLAAIAGEVDSSNAPDGAARALLVFNPHPFASSVEVEADIGEIPGNEDVVVVDASGTEFPTELERIGSSGVVRFIPDEIPPLGWKTYWIKLRGRNEIIAEVIAGDEGVIENDRYRITVDASRGGCLTSIYDKQLKRELLKPGGLGAEVVVREEYPGHTRFPGMGEGPAWLIHTNGESESTVDSSATLSLITTATRRSIIAEAPFGSGTRRMVYTLCTSPGSDRLDITIETGGRRGMDELVTLDFDFDLDGAMPFSEVSNFVVGRTPGWWEDVAENKFPLNFSCHRFCGLGAPLRVLIPTADGGSVMRSHAVGEIVYPSNPDADMRESVDKLVVALFGRGISTTAVPDDERPYGDRALDSNLPDFRILLGGAGMNKRAGAIGHGSVFQEGQAVYLEVDGDIPTIILNASDTDTCVSLIGNIARQVRAGGRIRMNASNIPDGAVSDPDWGVSFFNRGNIDFIADGDGRFSLSLYRAIAAEPGFHWMHPPERRLPDGTICQSQHWSHRYEFSFTSFAGDYSDAELGRKASEFNRPPMAVAGDISKGNLPASWSLITSDSSAWEMSCFKGPFPADYVQGINEMSEGACILRLYEGRGDKTEIDLKFKKPINGIIECDLTEQPLVEQSTSGGGIKIELNPFQMRTYAIEFETSNELRDVDLSHPTDPPAPHFSAYWHHDRHEAPTGNAPQSIIFKQRPVILENGKATIELVISNSSIDAAFEGQANIIPPDGFTCMPMAVDISLSPSGFRTVELRIEGNRDSNVVRWLRAEMEDINGNLCYDIVPIGTNSPEDFPIEIMLENDTVGITPGNETSLTGHVKNISMDTLPVHVELICPFETWGWIDEFEAPAFFLKPGEEREVRFVMKPGGEIVRGNYFAFLKVMAGDMSRFSEPIDIWRLNGTAAYLLEGRREVLPGEQCIVEADVVSSVPFVTGEPKVKFDGPLAADVVELSREESGVEMHKVRIRIGVTVESYPGQGEFPSTLKLIAGGEMFELPVTFAAGPYAEIMRVEPLSIEDDYGTWEPVLTPLGLMKQEHMRGIRGYNVDDLGAEPHIGWLPEGLFIGCRVRDNVHDNQHSGANIWRGDSVQIAIKKPNEKIAGSLKKSTAEYSFALTDSGLISYCHHNSVSEPVIPADGERVEFPLRVERIMDETFYEIFIPADAFGVETLSAGDLVRFNIAIHDADGMGWKGAGEWARGTVLVKDPDGYGAIRLVE